MPALKSSFYFLGISTAIVLAGLAAVASFRPIPPDNVGAAAPTEAVIRVSAVERLNQRAAKHPGRNRSGIDAQLRKRIAALESSLDVVHSQLENIETNLVSGREMDLMGDLNPDPDADDDPAAIEREQTDRLVSFLDRHMRGESVDVSWSEGARTEIAELFGENGFVNAVECYSTLCRVSADHADHDAEQHFISQLIALEAFRNTDAFVERKEQDDGSISTQIFIARGGYRLPDPAAP